MTIEEARKILKYHSFANKDINHPKIKKGFLEILRPFSGELIEENYHEVIEAIKVLADELRDNDKIDKEIVLAIWGICHLTRNGAIDKGGILQRNNLIKKNQIQKLEAWIESIFYATLMILEGKDDETAFEFYKAE